MGPMVSAPMATDGIASRTSGTVTTFGDSCGGWCASKRSLPWKAKNTRGKEERPPTKMAPGAAAYATPAGGVCEIARASHAESLGKKPRKGGKQGLGELATS